MRGKDLLGVVLRRAAPRTLESLDTLPALVRELQADLAQLRRRTEETAAEVESLRADLDHARGRDDELGEVVAQLRHRVDGLDAGVAEIDSGLAESRRLSLQVAQMTDLVFDRLAASPPEAAER